MKKVSIARIAIALGIILGVSGLVAVWGSWITPLEKKDIREALNEIQAIRSFQGQGGDAYSKELSVAEQAVSKCKKQAITEYDSRLTALVEMQLYDAIREQRVWQLPDTDPRKSRMIAVFMDTSRTMDGLIREHVQ